MAGGWPPSALWPRWFPARHLHWWLLASGGIVLAFAAATARASLSEARRKGALRPRSPWLVFGLLAIGGVEVYTGIRLW